MQHKTTLRVSDSRPNVNSFDRFKIFSSPPAQNSNEWTGPSLLFPSKKARKTLLKSPSAESRKFAFITEAEKGQSKNILQIQKNILNRNIFLKSLSKSLTNLKNYCKS